MPLWMAVFQVFWLTRMNNSGTGFVMLFLNQHREPVSWCYGRHCWVAIVLWSEYCFLSFSFLFVLRHLVIATPRNCPYLLSISVLATSVLVSLSCCKLKSFSALSVEDVCRSIKIIYNNLMPVVYWILPTVLGSSCLGSFCHINDKSPFHPPHAHPTALISSQQYNSGVSYKASALITQPEKKRITKIPPKLQLSEAVICRQTERFHHVDLAVPYSFSSGQGKVA